MADWVLNFTKSGVKVKKQLSAQARELLDAGLWGLPSTAQARDRIAPGDRVLVYVGAPERVLIGEAVVNSSWHPWEAHEAAQYPGTFESGIRLVSCVVWNKPIALDMVWPDTEGAKTNPKPRWYGAAVRLSSNDFAAIRAVGHEGKAPPVASANPTLVSPGGAPTPSSGPLSDSDALFAAAERLRKFLADPKPINETSTRAFFLDRVFDALGYDDFGDIDHGAAVQSGDFPDYVLRSNGQAVIAVEAKRLGHALGPKEASQLVKYCSVLGVRWGLLTDGRHLRVYDAPITGVPPEDRLVLTIDLADWVDREDFDLRRWPEAAMLTKAAMANGEAIERYAARELIRTILSDPSSMSIKALRADLEQRKVVLDQATIVSLVDELFA
ncbi:MAG TPA: hypothetical protein VN238_00530 [Solirubrobacteraceae bacterium]|nr:hypothetical protein [Solirubrobacteraceae bacterium]